MTKDPYRRRVKDVVSREIVYMQADGTIHDALALMVENRVAAIPVVDKRGSCQGILSATDVVDRAKGAGLWLLAGDSFFAERATGQYLRIAFSYVTPQEIKEGIEILGRVVRSFA